MNTEQEIMRFQFDSEEVMVIKDNNSELQFIAIDICRILDIKNVSQALNNLDDDERLIYKIHISGQMRDVLCVTESGLYALILRSTKPNAKKFRKWITSEVLPQIRKTGKYAINNQSSIPYLSVIADLENKLKDAEPKVEAYDAFMDAGDGVSLTTAAQEIGVKPKKLWDYLIINSYCHHKSRWRYKPYQRYIDAGYFKPKVSPSYTQTLVLPKGITYLNRLKHLI